MFITHSENDLAFFGKTQSANCDLPAGFNPSVVLRHCEEVFRRDNPQSFSYPMDRHVAALLAMTKRQNFSLQPLAFSISLLASGKALVFLQRDIS
jgi:hypothetical protein